MHTEDTGFDQDSTGYKGKKIRAFRHPKLVSGIILFGSWPSVTFYVKSYNPCCSEGSSKAPEAYAHMCTVGL